jgi:CpeT protein
MQITKTIATLLLLCASISSFAQAKKVTDKDVDALYELMTGSYSSEAQSKADSSYFDIRLQIVPCWKNKKSEKWFYVEQAMSTSIDSPYRQRVYQLKKVNDTTISSTIYTIKGGSKYYGDFKKDEPLKGVPLDSLEIRPGCAVFLHKVGKKKYAGSTNKSDCASNLRGAAYATSIVKVGKKKLVSWDQGFDKEGKQVWGAVKGGYEFVKLEK